MFRKIHSSRGKSAFAEGWQAMLPLMQNLVRRARIILARFPKTVFACMVILLIFSLLFNFSGLFSDVNKAVNKAKGIPVSQNLVDGLEKINFTAGKIRRNISLSEKVDSLLLKDKLTSADSLFLVRAIEELNEK